MDEKLLKELYLILDSRYREINDLDEQGSCEVFEDLNGAIFADGLSEGIKQALVLIEEYFPFVKE